MRIARSAWAFGLAVLSVAIAGASVGAARLAGKEQGAAARVSFNREILPILSNNCFACHGPDEDKRETKFHFDTHDGAFAKNGGHRPGQCGGELSRPAHHQPRPG